MIKTIYFCDKCGKEITGDIFDIAIGRYHQDVTNIREWNGSGYHLCSKCISDIELYPNKIEKDTPEVFQFAAAPIEKKTLDDIFDVQDKSQPKTFTIKFGNPNLPENLIFREIDNTDLPKGESEEAPCQKCQVKTDSPSDLAAAVQKLNNSVNQFYNDMPDSIKEKTNKDRIDSNIAKKFIAGVNNIPLHDLIMGGPLLATKIDNIIENFSEEEKERIRGINSEKELGNFFEKILRDALDGEL